MLVFINGVGGTLGSRFCVDLVQQNISEVLDSRDLEKTVSLRLLTAETKSEVQCDRECSVYINFAGPSRAAIEEGDAWKKVQAIHTEEIKFILRENIGCHLIHISSIHASSGKSAYGRTKRFLEDEFSELSRSFGSTFEVIRLPNIISAPKNLTQGWELIFPYVVRQLFYGRIPDINRETSETRSYMTYSRLRDYLLGKLSAVMSKSPASLEPLHGIPMCPREVEGCISWLFSKCKDLKQPDYCRQLLNDGLQIEFDLMIELLDRGRY